MENKCNVLLNTPSLSVEEAESLLLETEDETCSKFQCISPKPGDVYMFKFQSKKEKKQLKDKMIWINQGLRAIPKHKPVVYKRYFQRKVNDQPVDFYRYTYELIHSNNKSLVYYFCKEMKRISESSRNIRKRRLKKTDEEMFNKYEHMDADESVENTYERIVVDNLDNTYEHIVADSIEENTYEHIVVDEGAENTYERIVVDEGVDNTYQHIVASEAEDNTYDHIVAKRPRNNHKDTKTPCHMNQIENSVSNKRKEDLFINCSIDSVIEMNKELGNIVTELQLLPSLRIVMINKELIEEFSRYSTNKRVLSYDTTYIIGDFYISVLLARHDQFEGDPVFPIAVLLHEKKDIESHEVLFKRSKAFIPELDSPSTIFITDREEVILRAIASVLPKAHNKFCWKRIIFDVKDWVRKNLGDVKVDLPYTEYITNMLNCQSMDSYDKLYKQYRREWPLLFLNYFDKNLEEDLQSNIKAVLINFDIYEDDSGITITTSKHMNSVMKGLGNWKEVPIDSFVFAIYHLMSYYLCEIARGYKNLGEWSLKVTSQKPETDILVPMLYNSPDVIFDQLDLKVLPTKNARARLLVQLKRVHFEANLGVFIVKDYNGSHNVFSFDTGCSCRIEKNCVHALAVEYAIKFK